MFYIQEKSEKFLKSLLIAPKMNELNDWITCKINETRDLANGIQIQSNNKFIVIFFN